MLFSVCSTDAAEIMNDLLKNGFDVKYFANFVSWLPNCVVLVRVRKANFDVDKNILSLEFGR